MVSSIKNTYSYSDLLNSTSASSGNNISDLLSDVLSGSTTQSGQDTISLSGQAQSLINQFSASNDVVSGLFGGSDSSDENDLLASAYAGILKAAYSQKSSASDDTANERTQNLLKAYESLMNNTSSSSFEV